jgi:hypothetical protein
MPFIGIGVGIGRQRFASGGGGIFAAYAARVDADGGTTEAGECVDAVSALLQTASLLLVPSGYKSGKVYSEIPTNGDGDLTFTRASSATRVNSDGEIESVATGVPRLDYSQGSCPSLLLEPQRTNLFTYSEGTNNFSTLGRSNTTYSLGTGFNGFQSSCQITFSTFTNSKPRAVVVYNATSGQNNYFTLHFKKKNGFYVKISQGNATSAFAVELNLGTGELISTTGTAIGNTKVSILGDDTYQVGFLTNTTTTTSAGLFNIDFHNNSSFSNWTNSNASDFALISGIQWENQVTYGTSYIPTSGTSVTRIADAASKTGISSLIGQTEGTLFAEFNSENLESYTQRFVSVSDGTTSNIIGVQISAANTMTFYVVNGGVTQAVITKTAPAITLGQNSKIAVAYKANDFVFYINGVQVGTDTSGTVPATSQLKYSNANGAQPYVGKINQTLIFPTRLSNTELAQITTL